jgi:hypothetical protein
MAATLLANTRIKIVSQTQTLASSLIRPTVTERKQTLTGASGWQCLTTIVLRDAHCLRHCPRMVHVIGHVLAVGNINQTTMAVRYGLNASGEEHKSCDIYPSDI